MSGLCNSKIGVSITRWKYLYVPILSWYIHNKLIGPFLPSKRTHRAFKLILNIFYTFPGNTFLFKFYVPLKVWPRTGWPRYVFFKVTRIPMWTNKGHTRPPALKNAFLIAVNRCLIAISLTSGVMTVPLIRVHGSYLNFTN